MLTTAPMFAHVDMMKLFALDLDSSTYQIGTVLQQYVEDSDRKQT